MAKDIKEISLLDILPESIKNDENVINSAKAIDKHLQSVNSFVENALIISRIDELPEDVIDLLATQWHVDFYDLDLNIEQKRNLVKTSIAMHYIKGTKTAVEQAVKAVYGDGEVTEWFDYGGDPYFFRVSVVTDKMPTVQNLKFLNNRISAAKNVRSWLEKVEFVHASENVLHMGIGMSVSRVIDIQPEITFEPPEIETPIYVGGAVSEEIEISPGVQTSSVQHIAIATEVIRTITIGGGV